MSFTPNPALVPDRDNLPLKKRDQRRSSSPPPPPLPPPPPPQQQQQPECDVVTFKVPYPYRSHGEFKTKHTSPFQPVPKRVPVLHQPWMQTPPPTTSKPQVYSAFREHHGWTAWRDFYPLQLGWDFPYHYQHHSHLSGPPTNRPHHHSSFSPVTLVTEGFQRVGGGNSWEQLKTLRDKSVNTERHSNGRSKGPYVRRKDRKEEYFPRVDKACAPLSSARLPHSAHEDLPLQHDAPHKSAADATMRYLSGHSSTGEEKSHSKSTMQDAARSPALASSEPASRSSPSTNHFPWLLPHFVAGSLIELRDGRLRRVDDLQTEDFQLGSLACPDLRLSCCTVQSISPSASSSTISRLLILLHDQQSQEVVDVYVEYPFFVRGQGWSSCSPQRTAHLCGLQCRQLSVGDVCLALTPVSTPSARLEPKPSSKMADGGCESPKAPHKQHQVLPGPGGGLKKGAEGGRRRHYSAPELRGPGTNCI
ncbi:uncharacterized protein V6R79_018932 [Siganus canaliculatus]